MSTYVHSRSTPKNVVSLNATFLEEIKDRQCTEINRQKIEYVGLVSNDVGEEIMPAITGNVIHGHLDDH